MGVILGWEPLHDQMFSNTGSNLVIPGPMCSAIHSDPDLSNNKANGSSSGVSGTNSVISKF